MRKVISLETKIKIKELLPFHSVSEIAAMTGLCLRSIYNIQQEWNIKRSPEQLRLIRSKGRKKLVQDEKRRVLFGKDQKTNIKVVTNKERHSLKYRLKRKGYMSCESSNTLIYNNDTKRNLKYEEMGKKLGLTILSA